VFGRKRVRLVFDKKEVIYCACNSHIGEESAVLVDLPCGCQDVHYEDGSVCYEHTHVICLGKIEEENAS
jgi:hypothetical protein